jgi:hypothetical protein
MASIEKAPSQLDKFKQTARELECDESEEVFEQKLKKVAKEKPDDKSSG